MSRQRSIVHQLFGLDGHISESYFLNNIVSIAKTNTKIFEKGKFCSNEVYILANNGQLYIIFPVKIQFP